MTRQFKPNELQKEEHYRRMLRLTTLFIDKTPKEIEELLETLDDMGMLTPYGQYMRNFLWKWMYSGDY